MEKNQNKLSTVLKNIIPILEGITVAGGIPYLVGGCVRDLVLNRPIKDLDIEVHKLALDRLEDVLKKFGTVMLVGKKFGVLRIAGNDVDWSLPRTDSSGRKPHVVIDPTMSIEQACRRRDLTMNAMAIDLSTITDTPTIIDPYGGLEDIRHNRLRAVDEKLFLEDPLRFFRIMQFIGRFEMLPDEQLTNLCKDIYLQDPETETPLARERIYEEIKKLLLKSHEPSRGFRWLHSLNRLKEIFPEINALIGITQVTKYHPEGDAFEHTMQTIDAAAQLPYYHSEEEKITIMFGTLCHDLGKAVTTDAQGHAYGHERAGIPIAKKFLKRLTDDQSLIKTVSTLVHYHMQPFRLISEKAHSKAYKRLAQKIAPECNLRQLGLVCLADRQGRNGNEKKPLTNHGHELYRLFLEHAENASVAYKPEAPVLLGRHLIDLVPAGPKLGKLLKRAYHLQIEEGITNIEELKKRVMKNT